MRRDVLSVRLVSKDMSIVLTDHTIVEYGMIQHGTVRYGMVRYGAALTTGMSTIMFGHVVNILRSR